VSILLQLFRHQPKKKSGDQAGREDVDASNTCLSDGFDLETST